MRFGIWELLVILLIVMVIFGTTRLGSIGSDLGKAVRGFRRAVSDDDKPDSADPQLRETSETGETDESGQPADPGKTS